MEVEAVVVRETGSSRVENLHLDTTLASGEALVRVVASGVCGSDFKLMTVQDGYLPMILGHEMLAVVEGVAGDVFNVSVGDTVIAAVTPACGHCAHCLCGSGNLCDSGGSVVAGPLPNGAFHFTDSNGSHVGQYCFLGSFASHVVVGARQLLPIPDYMINTPEVCVLGCVGVTGGGAVLYNDQVRKADSVTVVGFGGVGASVLMAVKAVSRARITVIEPAVTRRELALAMGADQVLSSVDQLEAQDVCDVAFDATPSAVGVNDALHATRRGGSCIVVSMPSFGGRLDLDLWDLTSGQKSISGTVTSTAAPSRAIDDLLRLHRDGRYPFEELVDATVNIGDVPAVLNEFSARPNLKTIVAPNR